MASIICGIFLVVFAGLIVARVITEGRFFESLHDTTLGANDVRFEYKGKFYNVDRDILAWRETVLTTQYVIGLTFIATIAAGGVIAFIGTRRKRR
ncbi:MAG: hypothetical protein AAGK09_01155 [Planctomycetota bacterium]